MDLGAQEGSHNQDGTCRAVADDARGRALYMAFPCVDGQLWRTSVRRLTARPGLPVQESVWSIVGDSGSVRNDQKTDLEEVVALAGSTQHLRRDHGRFFP